MSGSISAAPKAAPRVSIASLQPLGRALMLPIAVLPVAAILLRLGSPDIWDYALPAVWAAHVHPVLIIFCFLAGGIILGIPGVILAVPVALVVKSTLATLYGDEPS